MKKYKDLVSSIENKVMGDSSNFLCQTLWKDYMKFSFSVKEEIVQKKISGIIAVVIAKTYFSSEAFRGFLKWLFHTNFPHTPTKDI